MASSLPDSPFPDGFELSHRLTVTPEGKEEDNWYITHLSTSPQQDILAAGGPHGSIKLFMMDTFLYCGDFKAHEGKITGLEFSHNNQHCFWTASSDTALSLWDTRKTYRAPVHRILSQNNCPFTSCGLNCSDEIVAAATEPYGEDVCLYLWDTRNLQPSYEQQKKPLQVFTDSHNRDITQIRFSPVESHQLTTGSIDGLMCLFDVSKGREDDCLESVLNSGSSVSQVGYYGSKHTNLYCLTHIETLQLWDIAEATMTADFPNAREDNKSGKQLEYLVDCFHHQTKEQLFLLGGTSSGGLHLFVVEDSELQTVGPLMGGHTSIVRCLHWDCESETIITGGEDSIIACWRPSSSQTTKTGKVVSAAVDKLRTHGSKPYEKPNDRKT